MTNIWILTEEMPKDSIIRAILEKMAIDSVIKIKIENLKIVPIIKNGCFVFTYKVEGATSADFTNVFIKIASGSSSFVDFLVFLQENQPDENSIPIYAIEETKTDDSESRNTGVYQRCSKFVYVDFYYPNVKKIMFYSLQIPQKESPTETNIFGTKMLRTIGVEIIGKTIDAEKMKPFSSIEEMVKFKSSMRKAPSGNVPIGITVYPDRIEISGRLYKAGGIGHDPNIGALTIIASCIRKWDKDKKIIITQHGLKKSHLGKNNKFIQIANRIKIGLFGLDLPIANRHDSYWHYENSQEKMATIFMHVSVLAYTQAKVVYSNHGGCERGYFIHKTNGPIAIPKYKEGKSSLYKSGDKTQIIYLPDMIVFDEKRNEIIDIEGKKYSTRKDGIKELNNYSYIDNKIIKPSYSPKTIIRTVAIFGSKNKTIPEKQIGFMLNENGEMVLGSRAPEIFKEVINKLLAA